MSRNAWTVTHNPYSEFDEDRLGRSIRRLPPGRARTKWLRARKGKTRSLRVTPEIYQFVVKNVTTQQAFLLVLDAVWFSFNRYVEKGYFSHCEEDFNRHWPIFWEMIDNMIRETVH
jgi:hypothetical protein